MISSKLALFVFVIVAAAVSVAAQGEVPIVVKTPSSASPASAGLAVDLTQAQIVAQRLRKIWPGGDVGVIGSETADNTEDAHEVLSRLNNKYGIYDRYNLGAHIAGRKDLPPKVDDEVTDSDLPAEAEDYKTVYNAANKLKFDATVDNPENLEAMLGSLWGKRYNYQSQATQEDEARASNTIVMRATPASNERMSIRSSVDGSVDKFVAVADDAAELAAAIKAAEQHPMPSNAQPPAFKPKMVWYGPRVSGAAMDVTGANLGSGEERLPNDPPKPPVQSFIFPDFHNSSALAENESPITIIETIRVTPEAKSNGIGKKEKVFTPIMATPAVGAKPAFIVG